MYLCIRIKKTRNKNLGHSKLITNRLSKISFTSNMLFYSTFHLTGKKVQVDFFLTKTTENILIDNNNIPMCCTLTGYLNKKKTTTRDCVHWGPYCSANIASLDGL